MPLKWMTKPDPSQWLEEPHYVLAAPGSVTPATADARRWLMRALAASSVALVAFRPYPGPVARPLAAAPLAAASAFMVNNLNPTGTGSLRQAITDANNHPGPDIVNFSAGLTGLIPLTTQITISDSVQIVGPGPGALSVSGSNLTRVFYLKSATVFTSTISGLTLRDGNSGSSSGGAIRDIGQPLTLDHVNLISNTTQNNGGAIVILLDPPSQGALTLRNSLVTGNHAGNHAGGVATYYVGGGVQISNTQFISNSSGAGGGALFDTHSPSLVIDASSFISNSAGSDGGGITFFYSGSSTIRNSTLSGNSANQGGGVYLKNPGGLATIQDSTFGDNHASLGGGGLTLKNVNASQVVIRRTTFSGNGAQRGGGLQLRDIGFPILLEDSTVSGNNTLAGGGLYFNYVALDNIAIQNSTIVSNSATSAGGGVLMGANVNGTLALTNTIIANNSAIIAPDLANAAGAFQLSYDLVEITDTATISDAGGNLFGLDPLLSVLANNGGPTQTHRPLPGSPVVDAGDPAFAPPPSTDQRGQPREVGMGVDIGAVEVNTGSLQFSASSFQVAENAAHATITVTRTGGSDGAASVLYSTGGGTATSGTDYQAAGGSLNWASGDAAPKTFQVTILSDNLAEGNEVIGMSLMNNHGAALGTPSSAILTIIDAGARLFLPLVRR